MEEVKNIALVAHDNRKKDLIIPIACNRSTADFLISSSLMDQRYQPVLKDYSAYIERALDSD